MKSLHGRAALTAIASLVVIILASVAWLTHSKSDVPRRIVVILPSSSNPFWVDVKRGAERAAASIQPRYTVQIVASQDQDANSQVELLNGFLTRRSADALVLGPASDVETVPAVARYNQASIPVVVIDTELKKEEADKHGAHVDAFIGSDNIDGGRKAAKAMAEALRSASSRRVLLIEGNRVHQSAIDRADGFLEVGKAEKLDIVPLQGLWKRDRAQDLVLSQLSRGRIDGIFASNDDMAMGAIAALKARAIDRSQWPVVIGFDATNDGLAAVTKCEMYTTVAQDARRLGESGVLSAKHLIERQPVVAHEVVSVTLIPPTCPR